MTSTPLSSGEEALVVQRQPSQPVPSLEVRLSLALTRTRQDKNKQCETIFLSSNFKIMTPELNPCFYYISVRGFDRLLIISTILFGGFYHIANQVIDYQREQFYQKFLWFFLSKDYIDEHLIQKTCSIIKTYKEVFCCFEFL